MATIHKLTKDGATIFPATITDAVVHPQTGKTLTSMMKDYNVSELFPTEGIDGGNKYNLALAIQVLGTHLSAAQKTGGIKLTFISSVSPYPEEEYYLGKSSWSGSAADWDQRFEVGDVIADPSGSWTPGTAEQYIDQQTAILTSNLAAETIGRQTVDSNLQTQINSEVSTRTTIDNAQNGRLGVLEEAYRNLTESDVIVGPRPSSGQQANVIYREPDQGHTPPQFYCDYMWYNSDWVLMAKYDNGIDDNPLPTSNNLVKSKGVFNSMGAFDISAYNSSHIYQNLTEALNAVPNNMRAGGMSVKFIQEITPAQYSVVRTPDLTTQPTGTALSEDPNIVSGTYTAAQLNNLNTASALPSTLHSSKTYYLEVSTGNYTSWVVTYVHSYDNKYVQARLMADEFTTDITKWQSVDEEPTAGSDNLVKSRGVIESIGYIPFSATAGGKTGIVYVLGTATAPGLITKGGFKVIINSETAQDVFYIREFDKNGTNLGAVLLTGEYIVADNNDIYGISVFKGGTVDTSQYKVDIAIVSRQFFSNEKAITALNNSFSTDTVHLTSQSLSDAQKEQVKDNLGIEEHKQTFVIVDDYESLALSHNWAPAINQAIIDAGEGGAIEFTKGKRYEINDPIKLVYQITTFIGNGATLYRYNSQTTTITEAIDSNGSNTIKVEEILSTWKVGDTLYIVNGTSKDDVLSGSDIKITEISTANNTITLSAPVNGIPIGATVMRSYGMIEGAQYPTPNSAKIYNLVFNGNGNKNKVSYYWYINPTVSIYGIECIIDGCRFINIPNENIITSGAVVSNCSAESLNGSFVHLSCPAKNKLTYGQYFGTRVIGNIVYYSNKISPTITGHSQAVIEQSWNPGYLIVANNYFKGYNTSSCFEIQSPTPIDGTTSEVTMRRYVIIENNIFDLFAKISRTPDENVLIEDKMMINNIFKDCGTTNWGTIFNHKLIIKDNCYCGNTVVNTSGNTYMYRIDTEISTIPSASDLTTKYSNLPEGGQVYITQLQKQYRKILVNNTTTWIEEPVQILS